MQTEANSRKRKILQLISDELTSNLNLLLSIQERSDNPIMLRPKGQRFSDFYQLKIELWNAFSDGGELEWIDDLDLLQAMASAYENIKMVLSAGKDYYSLERTLALQYGGRGSWPSNSEFEQYTASEKFHDSLKATTSQIYDALEMINPILK